MPEINRHGPIPPDIALPTERGFYWVRDGRKKWTVAEWAYNEWYLTGNDEPVHPLAFEEFVRIQEPSP